MNRDIDHILKFKPAGDPPTAPHNMPLWWDICEFFRYWFNDGKEFGYLTADQLIDLLQNYHRVQYTDAQIEQLKTMLEVEYKSFTRQGVARVSKIYTFYREDFFKPITE